MQVVAKFSPSQGVNFWVRCASGNVYVDNACLIDGNVFLLCNNDGALKRYFTTGKSEPLYKARLLEEHLNKKGWDPIKTSQGGVKQKNLAIFITIAIGR